MEAPWGHFWSPLDAPFVLKNRPGRQRWPRRRHPQNKVTHVDPFGRSFLVYFLVFFVEKWGLETGPFFLRFWGRPERFKGWSHMQSVHACAVQAHFSVFASSLKSRCQQTSCWVALGSHFRPNQYLLVKRSKNCFRKAPL